MPIYTYECGRCSAQRDLVLHMSEPHPKKIVCEKGCGRRMARIFKPHRISSFTPYVTPHITGEPLAISSARQELAVCKQYGVSRMLDSEVRPKRDKKKEMQRSLDNMPPMEKTYQEVTRLAPIGQR